MLAGKALMHRFSLVVAPMKRDLKLDDLSITLLLDTASTIFSATIVIPLAHMADRWNRRGRISISICVFLAIEIIVIACIA